MSTTLADGVVSGNLLLQPGDWAIVTNPSGATILLEYTKNNQTAVDNSAATWATVVSTTNSLIAQNDGDLGDVFIRITSTGAASEYEVTGEMTQEQRSRSTGFEKYAINTIETQIVPTSKRFVMLEDFDGTWAIGDAGPADRWSTTAGSGANTAVATTVAASVNGEVTLKSSSADDTHAANCSTLTTIGLSYLPTKGGLAMETRLKISDVSEAVMFVGFTDTISTTVELPIFLVAGDIDSDAANACGVGYDVDGTTKQFFHGGVKAGTDTVPAYSGSAPSDGVYFVVRVEVYTAGAVQGFINGKPIGIAVANAITASTPVCPMVVVGNRSANQVIATIDYIKLEQDR
jgi:hypothetical protein